MDNLLTNKYFCIALVIALVVMVYLYSKADYCSIEGMRSINFTPIGKEFNPNFIPGQMDPAWTDNKAGTVNPTGYLPRSDEKYLNYADKEDMGIGSLSTAPKGYILRRDLDALSDPFPLNTGPVGSNAQMRRNNRSNMPMGSMLADGSTVSNDRYQQVTPTATPMPLDSRPDLSQCQPCNCDAPKKS